MMMMMMFYNSIYAPRKTYISVTKTSGFMLFREILSVYYEEPLIHCRGNTRLFNVFLKLFNYPVSMGDCI
jgi:hypothetical protein